MPGLESNDCWERCQAANWPVPVSRSECTRPLGEAGLLVPRHTEAIRWKNVLRQVLNLATEPNIIICFANVCRVFNENGSISG